MAKKTESTTLQDVLKMLAPGQVLRAGIDFILKAQTGGLMVLGDPEAVLKVADGGFSLDVDVTPNSLYELAKMDGAILLTADGKRIFFANVQVVPDPTIPTTETGTRHRSAERMARQTGCTVICISESRNMVTVYFGDQKYVLQDLPVLLAKASQALQTLEKYRRVYEKAVEELDEMELEDFVTVGDVVGCVEKAEMVLRVGEDVERSILELGSESRLVSLQMEQLISGTVEELQLILRDYAQGRKDAEKLFKDIRRASLKDILNGIYLADLLGFGTGQEALEQHITPRGYRILRKLPRLNQPLPVSIIEKIINTFGNLQGIIQATPAELDDVEGIGDVRAQAISNGIKRVREQVFLPK